MTTHTTARPARTHAAGGGAANVPQTWRECAAQAQELAHQAVDAGWKAVLYLGEHDGDSPSPYVHLDATSPDGRRSIFVSWAQVGDLPWSMVATVERRTSTMTEDPGDVARALREQ